VPAVVALTDAEEVVSDGLAALSRLLRSARPVQVLIRTKPLLSAGQPAGNSSLRGYHLELGYLGIGHHEVMVQQSSSARPQHLHRACCRALQTTHPAMIVVSSVIASDQGAAEPAITPWLREGAALDGRAHPLFSYDPEAGRSWARRFEFSGNPDPAADWPVYELRHRGPDGNEIRMSLPFTFADFVLLAPEHRAHFCVVPAGKDVEDLIPMDSYLALPQEEAAYQIPFVWTVDSRQRLQRLAVTRQLAFACRDRLGFWRTLQELAGVRSEHVDRAVTEAREAATQEAARERIELQAAHEEQLQRARRETASEAMKALAATLLQLDTANLQGLPTPGAVTSALAAAAGIVLH